MNAAGQVLGVLSNMYSSASGKSSPGIAYETPFFWQSGKMTLLVGFNATGLGLNNQGKVVGGGVTYTTGASQTISACIWQYGHTTDLNNEIAPGSGWVLEGATTINDHGQIVGYGKHNGQDAAFLLTPLKG